ncbi:MAG: hypothetical protein NZM37_09520 [Sandaracinaceae bacterium]|nr:hypothetical protein [Sandaracinaceae bacterium]
MGSPLVGYNTNVRHRGKLFHVQTEDSGSAYCHVYTHLFGDGGRIIASKKTSYREFLGTERYPEIVRKLMQAQHKAMLRALRDGLFDEDEAEGARRFSEQPIVIEDEPNLVFHSVEIRPSRSSEPISRPAKKEDDTKEEPKGAGEAQRPSPPPSASPPSEAHPPPRICVPPPSFPHQRSPFHQSRPRESIFGQEVLSERTLDEVILSYLQRDLEKG